MKIFLDGLQAGNRSGTGTYASALIRHLPVVMPEAQVYAVCGGAACQEFAGAGLKALYPSSTLPPPLGTFQRNADMLRRLRRVSPDIVHYPANFCRMVGRGLSAQTRMVLTVHDLSFVRHPEWFRWDRSLYYRSSIARSVRSADLILADSAATAGDLRDLLQVPGNRIRVVPLGVEEHYAPASPEDIDRVRVVYRLPERFFLYLGTIEPRKNLPRLIEAYDRVAKDVVQDLVIAGRFGWKVEGTKAALAKTAHRDRIHLPGFVAAEDMPAVYSAADAFVWPSLWEGFGLPPLEAMACGTSVVTSAVASLPEVVGAGALLVDPEDVRTLAEAMRRVAEDDALRERLVAAGRERAARFTWRHTAERTADAYRALLGES